MKKLNIFDVANWFLSKEEMTHKKLQKLCYYAYSWFIYIYNDNCNHIKNRLFEEKFYAWVHGPINVELYEKYKNNKFYKITKTKKPNFLKKYNKFLEEVWIEYGKYNGDELESISKQEMPWLKARIGIEPFLNTNNKIDDRDIFLEYCMR